MTHLGFGSAFNEKKEKKKFLQLQFLQPEEASNLALYNKEGMESEDHTLGGNDEQMILTRRLSPIFQADKTNGREDGRDTTSVLERGDNKPVHWF